MAIIVNDIFHNYISDSFIIIFFFQPKSKSVQMNFDNKQASLLISDVTGEEEGEYCVEICNEIGEIAESSCFITVIGKYYEIYTMK